MSDWPQPLSAALADRYRIERQLGAGGMATVYLAHDLKHNRKVAVKVLRSEVASILSAERFVKEIEVTANLQHPNILPLYDSGEADSYLYYVMPHIEGESLRRKLDREGQLSLEETFRIAEAVAAALQFAHERGVVHRDIKPENVLLQAGQPLVADFGIALALDDAEAKRLTETGVSIGTPGYMSPEQATGERLLDGRTDIYSLGCLLYEMLSGEPPFTGTNIQAVLTKVVTEAPHPLRSLRSTVPKALEDMVEKALAKNPDERFGSAVELAQALAVCRQESAAPRLTSRAVRVTAGIAVLAAVVLGVVAYRLYRESVERRWLRETAIPEIEGLMGEARFTEAYRLETAALQRHPEDSVLQSLFASSTVAMDVISHPPGARVQFRGYASTDSAWYEAGVAPLTGERFPGGHLRVGLELAGYRRLELSFVSAFGSLNARLVSADEPEMVWVPAGTYTLSEQPVPLDSFRIDRHEVTNAEYQAFVDAGGYDEANYWRAPFAKAGREVRREEAMSELVDATGRPGPAGWELSSYPQGRESYPVGGVSWYEAAAYCAFAGKSLPSFYHWRQAAGLELGVWDDMLAFSNFGGAGPVPVESLGGVGPYGAHDMGGNVREWVWNAARDFRHVLGGASSDPEYLFTDGDAFDPWSRAPGNGFRCAKYESPPPPETLQPVEHPFFDFNTIEPVDDATYAIYRSFYEYEPTDLDANVLSVDSAEHWIKEKVDFTAAYGDERVSAYVFLPRNASPPYQTVVYFPATPAFHRRTSDNLPDFAMVGFIPKSGRVLVYPIYKGSYERYIENPRPGLAAARQRMVWMTQDLLRSVDYVVARPELRGDAIGYMGLSFGADMAVPIAIEKRFEAVVLIAGAFDAHWRGRYPPEASQWNFASRITTPTMLINGRRDFIHPYKTGQVPYFNAFAVPERDKRFVVLDSGHVPKWNDVIRHTLDWYDRYLGPVR